MTRFVDDGVFALEVCHARCASNVPMAPRSAVTLGVAQATLRQRQSGGHPPLVRAVSTPGASTPMTNPLGQLPAPVIDMLAAF